MSTNIDRLWTWLVVTKAKLCAKVRLVYLAVGGGCGVLIGDRRGGREGGPWENNLVIGGNFDINCVVHAKFTGVRIRFTEVINLEVLF